MTAPDRPQGGAPRPSSPPPGCAATPPALIREPAAGARRWPERLVHALWEARRYDAKALRTTEGDLVRVLDPGTLNRNAGPDFEGARVRIGDTEWAGAVEVHLTSGAWFDHGHHRDPRYDAVVLHVTLYGDVWSGHLPRADGTTVPEVVLYPRLEAPLRSLLYDFHTRPDADPLCARRWADVPPALREAWIDRLAEERLSERAHAALVQAPDEPALASVLHSRLFAGLGYAPNAGAMRELARRVPLALAHRFEDPLDVEALHFGAAGLLPAPADLLESDRATADYVMALRDRFERLNHRLGIPTMVARSWRFFRLRPNNFPPLRIAQGAALVHHGLLSRSPLAELRGGFTAACPVSALRAAFSVTLRPFWETHVRLERKTARRRPGIGRQRIDALLVNAAAPVVLAYALRRGDRTLATAVRDVLTAIPGVPDAVTRRFAALGTKAGTAHVAQGLHQLHGSYCRDGRCLACAVGRHLLDAT